MHKQTAPPRPGSSVRCENGPPRCCPPPEPRPVQRRVHGRSLQRATLQHSKQQCDSRCAVAVAEATALITTQQRQRAPQNGKRANQSKRSCQQLQQRFRSHSIKGHTRASEATRRHQSGTLNKQDAARDSNGAQRAAPRQRTGAATSTDAVRSSPATWSPREA